MARIKVLGGTGYAGAHIVTEAVKRGHEVTSYSRSAPVEAVAGATYITGSVLEDGVLAQAVAEAEVVIEALSPRGELAGRLEDVGEKLIGLARAAGVRLGVVGGAGSLLVTEGGPRLMDTEGFPTQFLPEVRSRASLLEALRGAPQELDWFYLSPAAEFGAFAPGEATGTYRTGGEVLLTDAQGRSAISGADLATAIMDEIETPTHSRTRFTIGY
jgi:putative NADH-flavin reductase